MLSTQEWPRFSWVAWSNRISTALVAKRWSSCIHAVARKVVAVVGQGWAPKARRSIGTRKRGKRLTGAGLDPAVVPGALHAALTVLERVGHDELRAGVRQSHRLRGAAAFRCDRARRMRSRATSSSSNPGPTTGGMAEAGWIDVQAPARPSGFQHWRTR